MAASSGGAAIFASSFYFLPTIFESFFNESLFLAVAVVVVRDLVFELCGRELLLADTFVFFINIDI